jgi:hypothetical protein
MDTAFFGQIDGHCVFRTDGQTRRWTLFFRQMDRLKDELCVFQTDGRTRWTLHFLDREVSVLILCLVDHGFQSQSGQTKDYKLGICCFSAKYTALKRKNKDLVVWNQDNMSLVERHVY